jgi:hypothetical protein
MHSTSFRSNSDFQLRYFIAGSCYTPDGAWALLYAQRTSARSKVLDAEARALERVADGLEKDAALAGALTDIETLRARAAKMRFDAELDNFILSRQGAEAELRTIETLMSELEPKRLFAHLPDLEAIEAAQREEWRLELMGRAENMVYGQKSIPYDHLHVMRMHPDFESKIMPHLHKITGTPSTPANSLPAQGTVHAITGDTT